MKRTLIAAAVLTAFATGAAWAQSAQPDRPGPGPVRPGDTPASGEQETACMAIGNEAERLRCLNEIRPSVGTAPPGGSAVPPPPDVIERPGQRDPSRPPGSGPGSPGAPGSTPPAR